MKVQTMHEACIRLSVALGQLQRADSHGPSNWDEARHIAIYRGDRERLTRLYESAPGLRMWIAPHIGIIDDGGDRAENPLGPDFKRRHFADLARGPSPQTLQLFAEHGRCLRKLPRSLSCSLRYMRTRWYASATGTARSKSWEPLPQTGGPRS